MDDVDSEIPLNASFPLPFRALFLAGLGILGWATNLHGLEAQGIDVVAAMELRSPDSSQPITLSRIRTVSAQAIYSSVYGLFVVYSFWWFASWTVFRLVTKGDISLVDVFGYIPAISALCILLVLICPFDIFHRHERDKLLLAIRRCLFAPPDGPIYFADVVFADIVTSFAKVLGDAWLSLCMLQSGNSLLRLPSQQGWPRWIMPMLMSLPYFVRLRQCLIEYGLPQNETRRPLYNALKYATSFPVIFLSAAQRMAVVDSPGTSGRMGIQEPPQGEHRLFRLWLLAAAVNSLYSFWWDISNDWGLELLRLRSLEKDKGRPIPPRRLVLPTLHSNSSSPTPSSSGSPTPARENPGPLSGSTPYHHHTSSREHLPYPYGLRPVLLYPLPVYPLLIFLNLVLRLTWSIKLSPHLHSRADGSMAIFWLEVAEIVRRWMWVFIRVEWEVVRKKQDGRKGIGGSNGAEYELIPTPTDENQLFP